MLLVYKTLNSQCKVDKGDWFMVATSNSQHTRMASDLLNLRKGPARLEVRRNFFTLRTVENWNKIPANVKATRSVTTFKNGYRQFKSVTPSEA